MSELVQVAVAQDPIEAEEIQALLDEAGIPSEVQPDGESDGLKVLVAEDAVEAAQDAMELPSPTDEPSTEP